MRETSWARLRRITAALAAFLALPLAHAQAPTQPEAQATSASNLPGQFDYFLLDMPWGPAFCSSIKDVSATCKPRPGFVVHGLWPQNNDGTWPQFCGNTAGPANPRANLDITPDLALLQHEWNKHGTCSGLTPTQFFAAAHQAFARIQKPRALIEATTTRTFTTLYVLDMFQITNPDFPPGSFSLSCRNGRVTAIEACFSKSLQPVRCQGLTSCDEQTVTFDPLPATTR